MTYLLDTNVCIAAMRGNSMVVKGLATRSPEDCAVSMVSVTQPCYPPLSSHSESHSSLSCRLQGSILSPITHGLWRSK